MIIPVPIRQTTELLATEMEIKDSKINVLKSKNITEITDIKRYKSFKYLSINEAYYTI